MKVFMELKRVQYQRIEFSEDTGYDVPEEINALIRFCEDIKKEPFEHAIEEDWSDAQQFEDFSITAFEVKQ